MISSFRASAPNIVSDSLLGPLVDLPGTWVGKGFNLISLPDKQGGKDFRIAMNATLDQITFSPIGAPFPDRGSVQDDIEFSGVHYLQRVSDADTDMALHLEPGLCSKIGATTTISIGRIRASAGSRDRPMRLACKHRISQRLVASGTETGFTHPHGLSGLDRDESPAARQALKRKLEEPCFPGC
jgi:hypothetical protein